MPDILIRDCNIYDGSGSIPFTGDISITGTKIDTIGDLSNISSAHTIDARGLSVSPGFIDTHAHSDGVLLNDPYHKNGIHQGITTEILGQDGLSYAPLSKNNYITNRDYLSGILGSTPDQLDMSSVEQFKSNYDEKISINTAYCIAHGAIRLEILGFEDKPLIGKDLERAKNMIREGMNQGAVGLATGMSYFPNAWSNTAELIELCKVVAEEGGVYVTHLRDKNTERGFGGGGVREALEIGRRSGVPVHFSHFRTDASNAGKVSERTYLIDKAIEEGLDISLELYPYPTGSSFPLSFLPSWAHEGGPSAVMERLSNRDTFEKLAYYLDNEYEGSIDEAVFSYVPRNVAFEGASLKQIALDRRDTLGTTLCNLLKENELQIGYWGSPPMSISTWDQINKDCMELLSRPDYMVGSDSIPLGKYPHPRAYGTFPRIIGRFQRKYQTMPLEQTIQRITENPAKRFKLKGRGLIKEGYFADLVLFDPLTVTDNATYDDPRQLPTGIEYVLVNGTVVIKNSTYQNSTTGRAIP